MMTDIQTDLLEDKDFDTILSSDIDFSGTLSFEKSFLVRGKISGEIIAHDLFMVDTDAVVIANVNGTRVVVRGFVQGNIIASDKLELIGGGNIKGNVNTPSLSVEQGCFLNGLCIMDKKKSEHENK